MSQSAGLTQSDPTCRPACISGKYYFEVMAHVLLKAGPYWASEECNVEQKGKVSLIVQDINPNQLWEGILTSERVETDERMGDRTGMGSTYPGFFPFYKIMPDWLIFYDLYFDTPGVRIRNDLRILIFIPFFSSFKLLAFGPCPSNDYILLTSV